MKLLYFFILILLFIFFASFDFLIHPVYYIIYKYIFTNNIYLQIYIRRKYKIKIYI